MWKHSLAAIALIVVLMLPASNTGTTIYLPSVHQCAYGYINAPTVPSTVIVCPVHDETNP